MASAAVSTRLATVSQHEHQSLSASTVSQMLDRMESACQAAKEYYEKAPDSGIESLRQCVRTLEDYAGKVREHEKASNTAHGRYRRAFVQTYAILKSVLGKDEKSLHRFKETFHSNHTRAATYLKNELDKIKLTADTIATGPASNSALPVKQSMPSEVYGWEDLNEEDMKSIPLEEESEDSASIAANFDDASEAGSVYQSMGSNATSKIAEQDQESQGAISEASGDAGLEAADQRASLAAYDDGQSEAVDGGSAAEQ